MREKKKLFEVGNIFEITREEGYVPLLKEPNKEYPIKKETEQVEILEIEDNTYKCDIGGTVHVLTGIEMYHLINPKTDYSGLVCYDDTDYEHITESKLNFPLKKNGTKFSLVYPFFVLGYRIRRKNWMGYWFLEKGEPKIKLSKPNKIIKMTDSPDMLFTLQNVIAEDWIVVDGYKPLKLSDKPKNPELNVAPKDVDNMIKKLRVIHNDNFKAKK